MKYLRCVCLGVTLIFLISLFFVFRYINIEMGVAIGDINGDGNNERIVLVKRPFYKFGKEVIIYSKKGEELFREDISDLKPWKVTLGDVDGDGISEISIGVYKETLFHPIMAKRPFVYNFAEGGLRPKWRGSRLSKPFTDYLFYDIDNDNIDELISIEVLNDGKKVINSYKWKGFGFESIGQSKEYDNIFNIYIKENNLCAKYLEGKSKIEGFIKYDNEKLMIERMVDDV